MIVLDIETTGLTNDCGICEIGAIDLTNPENYFLQDCRIDEEDTITEGALKVNGRTRDELFDKNKQSQKEMISNYLKWVEKQSWRIFYGQNVGWDISMIQSKSLKYNLHKDFMDIHGPRGMDLHTIAQGKYFELHGKYFVKENGRSAMNLSKILEFVGILDNRRGVLRGEIVKEGKPHGALADCRFEGEALYRIKFGKNLFDEFKKFEIPDYLKK